MNRKWMFVVAMTLILALLGRVAVQALSPAPQANDPIALMCYANADPHAIKLGDFDGDGKVDVFSRLERDPDNPRWVYSASGASLWRDLSGSDLPAARVHVGDFDGDGVSDLFTVKGADYQWLFKPGGRGEWREVYKDPDQTPVLAIKLGDFDGDGKTDLFSVKREGNLYRWRYAAGARGPWVNLGLAGQALSDLVLADVDFDGRTDVLSMVRNGSNYDYYYSSGGVGNGRLLRTSDVPLAQVHFGDFDGDGRNDIFSITEGGAWRYAPDARGAWQTLRDAPIYGDDKNVKFGDMDGDGKTDVFHGDPSGRWVWASAGRGPWVEPNKSNAIELMNAIDTTDITPGEDTIVLGQDCDYILRGARGGKNDLAALQIEQPLTILGNGSTIQRKSDESFRLLLSRAPLELRDVMLFNGRTDSNGGAIRADAKLTLRHVTLRDNVSTQNGGAVYARDGVSVADSHLLNNMSAGDGGGIFSLRYANILSSQIVSNTASGSGGGVYIQERSSIDHSTFERNVASTGQAGGLFILGGPVEIRNNIFIGNQSAFSGHTLYLQQSGDTSRIINNVWYYGGTEADIRFSMANIYLRNGATVDVSHNTFATTVNNDEGAIYLEGGSARIQNNIFYQIGGWGVGVATVQEDYNLFYGASAGNAEHDLVQDPQFVDVNNGDLRLKATSPARDIGMPDLVAEDIVGTLRPQGGGYDLGAYEYVKRQDVVYVPLVIR